MPVTAWRSTTSASACCCSSIWRRGSTARAKAGATVSPFACLSGGLPMQAKTPLRVLIADDEAPARSRLRDLLGDIAAEQPNEIVGVAANGVEALRLLEVQPA